MCIYKSRKKEKSSLKYASALKLIENNNISTLKKNIKILVVDDESDDIYQVLKERQYDVYYKSDMTYSVEAEPFEIIIMDIRGVAKRLHSSMEGFSLACEVKNRYPLKRVCCYSGSIHPEISEKLADNKIDAFFLKDLDMDKMCNKIDKLIIEYVDYHKQWEILRNQLVKSGINEHDINIIKEAYEDGFSNGNIKNLNNVVADTLKNGSTLLNITSSIISLMKVLAVN